MKNFVQPQIKFDNPKIPLVVVVTRTLWEEPPRMRHHITRQLLRWANVLFVELSDLPGEEVKVVSGRLCLLRCRKPSWVPSRLYANEPFTHSMLNRKYARSIERSVQNLESKITLLFNFVYDFPEIMRSSAWQFSIYVCFDEFPRMWRDRRIRNKLHYAYQSRLLQCNENQVAKAADLCLTPHLGLANKLNKVGAKVGVLHHAHEFTIAGDSSEQDLGLIRNDSLLQVAFMGFIHYRLLDEWLLALLREKDIYLNLIGPIAERYNLTAFRAFENFRHISPQVGDELARTLTAMDVLIMPYNPVLPEVEVLTTTSKLFQYIASGKPIVTSDLPNLIELPEGVIYRASGPEAFVRAVRQAQEEDNVDLRSLRTTIAAENTWDKRGEQLHGYLKAALGDQIPDLH